MHSFRSARSSSCATSSRMRTHTQAREHCSKVPSSTPAGTVAQPRSYCCSWFVNLPHTPNIMFTSPCRHHSTAASEEQGDGGRYLWQNAGRLMLQGLPAPAAPATPACRATAGPGAKCGELMPIPPLSTNLCVNGMMIHLTSPVHGQTQCNDYHAEGATRLENRWLQKTNMRRAGHLRATIITHVFLPPCEAPFLPFCRSVSVDS